MKRKSCLVQIAFFIVVMIVLASSIRRCQTMQQSSEAPRSADPAQVSAPAVSLPRVFSALTGNREGSPVASTPAPTATPDPQRVGIQGLGLPSSRPLLFDLPRVRGIEATDELLYVSSYDSEKKIGILYQVSQATYTIAQVRTYAEDGFYRMGGLHLGDKLLWTALTADDAHAGSLIVGIDPQLLNVVQGFVVTETIRAVAQVADATLIGADEEGSRLLAWSLDGTLLRQNPAPADVAYKDMDVIRGSLVCGGKSDDDVGMIDVIDPDSLTLLARHMVYAKSPAGRLVTARSMAYHEGRFFFLTDQGEFPMVMIYRMESRQIEDYVPSTNAH